MSVLPHWFIPSLLPLHQVGTSNSDTPPISITTSNPSIPSVDVFLYAYLLQDDVPDHQDIHKLIWMLCNPHLATALDSYLDLRSSFHALYQVFLQISRLCSLP